MAKERQARIQAEAARPARERLERERASHVSPLFVGDRVGGEVPGVTLELVRVPAGEFWMGSSEDDKEAFDKEKPQHTIHLPEYLIGKYPVTVAQFAAFVKAKNYETTAEQRGSSWAYTGSDWKKVKGANWQHPHGPDSDVRQKQNHPVTHVTWDDARAFCEWVSQTTGRIVCLPSEAEWEKAARGGIPSPSKGEGGVRVYPWGNEVPNDKLCNLNMNVGDTTPVGQYSPRGDSPYGCADMAGNVWEWTTSKFELYKYDPKDGREDLDDRHAKRVLRGGSFYNPQGNVRCACRHRNGWSYRLDRRGFRIFCAPYLSNL